MIACFRFLINLSIKNTKLGVIGDLSLAVVVRNWVQMIDTIVIKQSLHMHVNGRSVIVRE